MTINISETGLVQPFATAARPHWAAGLPVIPLRGKKPFFDNWSDFKDRMPSAEQQALWPHQYAGSNIGLPLGPQSDCVALDIDTDDPKVIAVLESVLPTSPWRRRGKKGFVLMYRYAGEQTFRIKGVANNTVCELLSAGTQVVLPPSIHPETGRPYTSNCDLLDVIDALPFLPKDIEIHLRAALTEAGVKLSSGSGAKISEPIAAGGRDTALVAHAGILSHAVLRGERTLASALNEITHWVETYPEKVEGDSVDREKGRQKLIEFLVKDVQKGRSLPIGWDEGLTEEQKQQICGYFEDSLDDAEEWSVERFKDFVDQEFANHDGAGSDGRRAAIERALKKAARSKSMSELDRDAILQHVNDADKTFKLGAMRKEIAKLKRGPIVGEDQTEIAKALLDQMRSEGEVRFSQSTFWQWRGTHWVALDDHFLLKTISDAYGSLPAARRYNDLKGVLKIAATHVHGKLSNDDVKGINFANGFLTLDLELLPHDPKYGRTYVLPYRYLSPDEATCPQFMRALELYWGHSEDFSEKKQALQEALSVTLFGLGPRMQRCPSLIGPGGSGKSTITSIVEAMLPQEAICAVPPQLWSKRWPPARLLGKLANICGELSEKTPIDGDRFKTIVAGETMEAEFKGKDIFKFKPEATHWFAANDLPKTLDMSDGFTRRWLFLQFDKKVSDEDKCPGFVDVLMEELEGIAAWCVPAIRDVLERGDYTLPASHKQLERLMAESNNEVLRFLNSEYVVRHSHAIKPAPSVRESALFQLFMVYCVQQGAKHGSANAFRLAMRLLASSGLFRINADPDDGIVYEYIAVPEDGRGARRARQ